MTLLHIRLRGPSTTVTLPASLNSAKFKLKSYRVLFNRNDHGYYLASLTSSLFDEGNAMNYVKAGEPGTRYNEIPLLLDPETKQTVESNLEWDLGRVRGTSSVSFNIKFSNCIERSRFDLAVFDSNDASITKLYNISNYQPYFGTKIPMYISPDSNMPDQSTMSPGAWVVGDFGSNSTYGADGTNNTPSPAPSNKPFPSSLLWVHTGVQVGNIDPQPGGADFDSNPTSVEEANIISKSGGTLPGSGFRRNAIIYAYSVDLVFEVTT